MNKILNTKIVYFGLVAIYCLILINFKSYSNVVDNSNPNIATFSEAELNNHSLLTRAHSNRYPEYQKKAYNDFLEKISKNEDFSNIEASCIYFNEVNRNLIIGHSGAVFLGAIMGREEMLHYGFDVVSFGGLFDEDICMTFDKLNKKYDNIVLYGFTNDLNLRASAGLNELDRNYCETFYNLINKAREHLNELNGKLILMRVKNMTLEVDHNDPDYIENYNTMAHTLNNIMDELGYITYEIPFDTSKEHTSHYIHYDKKYVYEKMLTDLNNILYKK